MSSPALRGAVPISAIAAKYASKYRRASASVSAASPSMSNEYRYALLRFDTERCSASPIVRPMTNWCPMMRIA